MFTNIFMEKFIGFFFFILFIGCNDKNNWLITETTEIVLQYDPIRINEINEDDYFWIDDIKIIHKRSNNPDSNPYNFILPTPVSVISKIEQKEFLKKTNSIQYALKTYELFKLHENKYEINNLSLLQTLGLLSLKRIDGKKIKVKKKQNYPLLINKYKINGSK